jgi:uncharacterized protein (TIGR03000 family)
MSLKKNLFVALLTACAVSMLADNSSAFFGLFRGGSHGSGGGWGSRGGWGSCGSHGGYHGGSHGSWGSHGGYGGSHGGYGGSHGGYGSSGGHGSSGGYYSAGYGGYGDGYYARRGVVRRSRIVATPSRETIVAQPAAKTRLTLRVPAEATVTLAGVNTKQTGEVRQFTTTRLTNGQVWDDYKIVVAMERDGQTLREERTIKLTGGVAQELSINFDSQQLAQR